MRLLLDLTMRFSTNFPRSVCPHPPGLFPVGLVGSKVGICYAASLVAVFCLLVYRSAIADGFIDSRSVTVEAGYDSDKSKTWYIDTQLEFSSGYWIYLAAQKNDVGSDDGFDLDSRSYFAGFGSDPEAEWSYDLTYENWGNPDDIDTDALRATITWTRRDWAFSIMPQYREIDLAGVDNGNSFSFNERGLGAGVQYSGIEDWALYLERYEYHFSKDPDFLEDIGVTDSLTFTATSLASGVYDYETVLGIRRWLDPVKITLQYTQDKSAIDNSLVKTTEAHVDYYLSDKVIPYLRIGRASFPGFSPLWFGNLGLQFVW
jgi:hypothetical protein